MLWLVDHKKTKRGHRKENTPRKSGNPKRIVVTKNFGKLYGKRVWSLNMFLKLNIQRRFNM